MLNYTILMLISVISLSGCMSSEENRFDESNLLERLDSLDSQVADLEGQIDAHTGEIYTHDSEISMLKSRMDLVEINGQASTY